MHVEYECFKHREGFSPVQFPVILNERGFSVLKHYRSSLPSVSELPWLFVVREADGLPSM